MLHSAPGTAISPIAIAERPAALSHRAADSLKESAIAASPQAREEEHSSPICAACWAY